MRSPARTARAVPGIGWAAWPLVLAGLSSLGCAASAAQNLEGTGGSPADGGTDEGAGGKGGAGD